MKLIPFLSLLACLSWTALADVGSTTVTTTQNTVAVAPAAPDSYQMVTGTVVERRGNDTAQLQVPVKLGDGSTLTPGGSVIRADGTRNQLAEGQVVSPAGKLGVAPAATGAESTAIDKPAAAPNR